MRAHALVALTLPAPDPVAARAWWSQALGLLPGEDDPEVLDVNDVAVSFGAALSVTLVGSDLPEDPVPLTDPAGTTVRVVPPDLEGARRAEESISEFVAGAADLPGRPVDALVDDVVAHVLVAQERIVALLADQPNDKVLATMLEIGQRSRAATDGVHLPWHLHAASTLVSGCLRPGS